MTIDNHKLNEYKTIIIVSCVIAAMITGFLFFVPKVMPSKQITSTGEKQLASIDENDVLYGTIYYYYYFGSTTVMILKNGDVYTDTEIEEPMHEPNYEFARTLDQEELAQVTKLVEKKQSGEDLRGEEVHEYVHQIIPESWDAASSNEKKRHFATNDQNENKNKNFSTNAQNENSHDNYVSSV